MAYIVTILTTLMQTIVPMKSVTMILMSDIGQRINIRAFGCDPIDFAELNSLDFGGLEEMYCSASLGHNFFLDRFNKATADNNSLAGVNATIQQGRAAMAMAEKCFRTLSTAGDLQRRKFKEQKFDCSQYKLPSKK